MSTIHLHATTTATPEQYIGGLTDFGPGRSEIFSNSTDAYLRVHTRGRTQADVTEGSGGIWERLHYDWSDPHHVVLTTTDSNIWGGASGHTYTFTRNPDGTTDIDVVVVRDGRNLRGRLLGFVLGTVGSGVLRKAFEKSVKAIEARGGAARLQSRTSLSPSYLRQLTEEPHAETGRRKGKFRASAWAPAVWFASTQATLLSRVVLQSPNCTPQARSQYNGCSW